jgi:hypothetical protein
MYTVSYWQTVLFLCCVRKYENTGKMFPSNPWGEKLSSSVRDRTVRGHKRHLTDHVLYGSHTVPLLQAWNSKKRPDRTDSRLYFASCNEENPLIMKCRPVTIQLEWISCFRWYRLLYIMIKPIFAFIKGTPSGPSKRFTFLVLRTSEYVRMSHNSVKKLGTKVINV